MTAKHTLAFRATAIDEALHSAEIATVSFRVEPVEGEASVYFSMMTERPDDGVIRVWWGDGSDGRDECCVHVASASLTATQFRAVFAEPRPPCAGGYTGVEISFAGLDEQSAVATAIASMLRGLGSRLDVDAAIPPRLSDRPLGPPAKGPPMLGVASPHAWRVRVGDRAEITLSIKNLGGALAGAIVELGGPALDAGLITPATINAPGCEATFRGASAELPQLRVPAHRASPPSDVVEPPPLPTVDLRLLVHGARVGSALLTIRLRSLDGSAAAMCGRAITVE